MALLRSNKATYVAAFLLGALIGALLLAQPAHSAEPFRLDRIGIDRFTDAGNGKLLHQIGVLELDGRVTWRPGFEMPRPANTPGWALNRNLITVRAWLAYRQLGARAMENFELTDGAVGFAIGEEIYHFVSPSSLAAVAAGRMINISTRTRIAAGDEPIIAGFVIEERPRIVLVRAVGPGLARFGVTGAAADPLFSLQHDGATIESNDNWSTHPDAASVRAAAAHVGAFPLEDGSRDAARLLVLPPGAYTAHVATASSDRAGGIVLVEIYSVPDDVLVTFPALPPALL